MQITDWKCFREVAALNVVGVEEWVNMAQNNYPRIIGKEQQWYMMQKLSSVPHPLLEIQSAPPVEHTVFTSALEPILVVTMPGVEEKFTSAINDMTHWTNLNLVNLFDAENVNLAHEDLNTSIDEPENWWNICLISYDTWSSRAKPSSNGQLSNW